jgi:pimeloyl-ACP methyl ester carboxylesterase
MERRTIATARGAMSALVDDRAGPDAPWLHFAHATGMCAPLYADMLAPLARSFRIAASDARGHGQSPLPADPALMTDWALYAADLSALLDALDAGAPWLLAGHSMGGCVSALVAAAAPQRVAGLALIEPAFVPFAAAPGYEAARRTGHPPPNPMADQAVRRRSDFPGREAARAAWLGRGVFASWRDATLDAYLDGGLRAGPDGVTLACVPTWEAATFRAVSTGLEAALDGYAGPLALLAGTRGSTVQPEDFTAIAARSNIVFAERLEGADHFVATEAPDHARAAIAAIAGAA